MKIKSILTAISVIPLLISCKSDSTGPSAVTPHHFSLNISVRNSNGGPVPGLRISAWNLLSPVTQPGLLKRVSHPPTTQSVTSIAFETPVASSVDLSAFELDGTLARTIFSNDRAAPGRYSTNWIIHGQVPTRVFKCRFVARDTASGVVLFKDSIYAVLQQPDASISILGWTDASGTFETQDTLLFPNLLTLPPLVCTDANGTRLGTFSITDSVLVTLSDTTAQKSHQFARIVRDGVNDIQLVWNPTAASAIDSETQHAPQGPARQAARNSTSTLAWKLEQNAPNPFN